MAVVVNTSAARRTGRVTRSPRHTFQLRHKPFLLQPFMFAPVLPGDTVKNMLLQARAVTSPIANPLVGWWLCITSSMLSIVILTVVKISRK